MGKVKWRIVLSSLVLVFCLTGVAQANQVYNPTLDLNGVPSSDGWDKAGSVLVTNDFFFPFLKNKGMTGFFALLGPGQISGVSSMSQNLDVTGMTTILLTFNWAFDYSDYDPNKVVGPDTFVLSYGNGTITYPELIASSTHTSLFGEIIISGTYSKVIDVTGWNTMKLGFTINENVDVRGFSNSSAAIDNVSVTPVPPAPR